MKPSWFGQNPQGYDYQTMIASSPLKNKKETDEKEIFNSHIRFLHF